MRGGSFCIFEKLICIFNESTKNTFNIQKVLSMKDNFIIKKKKKNKKKNVILKLILTFKKKKKKI